MAHTIRQQYFYDHSPEAVWAYLTTPELMAQWLMPNDFELRVGHEFQFRYKPIPAFNVDGIFHCRVLEVLPLKKLSYTWTAGPGDGTVNLDTIVVWTLAQKDEGTELHLEHSGFKEKNFSFYEALYDGWQEKFVLIAERLNLVKNDTATH